MKATYKNPWYNPRVVGSREEFTTDVAPVEYKGYLLYHRVASTAPGGDIWDVVKDGVCLTERAGPRGARDYVDTLVSTLKGGA